VNQTLPTKYSLLFFPNRFFDLLRLLFSHLNAGKETHGLVISKLNKYYQSEVLEISIELNPNLFFHTLLTFAKEVRKER
jgi:hypothetical protein